MDLFLVVLSALINGSVTALAIYLGFRKGVEKTVEAALNIVEERIGRSIVAQRVARVVEDGGLEKALKMLDEASNLLSSSEAREFFKTLTTLLSSKPPLRSVEKMNVSRAAEPRFQS
jgi:ABC-type enterobactin transport system permease subunit